jgi:N-acetylneuraminic acid mutarotase
MLCIVAFTHYSPAQAWVQKLDLTGGWRFGAVGFSIGTKGYIGTGNGAASASNDFWEYDPIANTWTQKANVGPSGRYQGTGFAVNGKGYIGCGDDSVGTTLQDFWEYDPTANTWTARANYPGGVRDGIVSFGIGTKGYMGTGGDQYGNVYNDFYEFNPATNTWTAKANFAGTARYFATAFSIGSLGYITTGYDGYDQRDLYEYNPATDVWTAKASCPGGSRSSAQSFSVLSRGYIINGQDSTGTPRGDCWEYNPTSNTWYQVATFTGSARSAGAAFAVNNKGYYGTGDDGTYWNQDFYMFDPAACTNGTITTVIAGPSITCGITHPVYTATLGGASSYTWTVPTGITISSGSGTSSITTTVATSFLSGTISCTATNACGVSVTGTYIVTKKPLPPATINGPALICGATTATYNVAPVTGATSYTWSLASGLTIASGAGTTAIVVNVASTFVAGNISVVAVNACGSVAGPVLAVTGNHPAAPGTLSGPSYVCGLTTATYSVPVVAHATGYVWTVPSWMTITSGNGTNSITVSATGTPAASNISVAATDACGTGTARVLALKIAATTPGVITGPANICGTTSAAYSVVSLGAGFTYAWSTTAAGWAVTSGQGTNAITLSGPSLNTTTYSALVKVTSSNTCGSTSSLRTLGITACHDGMDNNNLASNTSNDFSDIYPNPASNTFNIDIHTTSANTVTLEVYDVLGKVIINTELTNRNGVNTIDVSGLAKGMYFVRMNDEKNNSIYTQRVSKE